MTAWPLRWPAWPKMSPNMGAKQRWRWRRHYGALTPSASLRTSWPPERPLWPIGPGAPPFLTAS
eukprot:4389076-Alexandrium_andersonii.AAC.1